MNYNKSGWVNELSLNCGSLVNNSVSETLSFALALECWSNCLTNEKGRELVQEDKLVHGWGFSCRTELQRVSERVSRVSESVNCRRDRYIRCHEARNVRFISSCEFENRGGYDWDGEWSPTDVTFVLLFYWKRPWGNREWFCFWE